MTLCTPEICGVACDVVSNATSAVDGNSTTPVNLPLFSKANLTDDPQQRNSNLSKRALYPLINIHNPGNYVAQLARHITASRLWLHPYYRYQVSAPHGTTVVGRSFSFVHSGGGTGAVGVAGLYGCTSVIIFSWSGILLINIWEVPAFANEDGYEQFDPRFIQEAFAAIQRMGIDTLIAPGGTVDPEYGPEVFIITPKMTFANRWREGESFLQYQLTIDILSDMLHQWCGGRPPQVIGYDRGNPSDLPPLGGGGETGPRPYLGVVGSAIVEVDLDGTNYTLVHDGREVGNFCLKTWRLWVGDRFITEREFYCPSMPSL
ncbi:MAG: hypothetical protein Q9157_005841 [Trypethelium eluteriae]